MNQPTPPIYRIADRKPEFPCWLWGALTQAGWNGPCGWYRGLDHWYLSSRCETTHWSPEAPTPPQVSPEPQPTPPEIAAIISDCPPVTPEMLARLKSAAAQKPVSAGSGLRDQLQQATTNKETK